MLAVCSGGPGVSFLSHFFASDSFLKYPPCSRMWPLSAGMFLNLRWHKLHSTGFSSVLARFMWGVDVDVPLLETAELLPLLAPPPPPLTVPAIAVVPVSAFSAADGVVVVVVTAVPVVIATPSWELHDNLDGSCGLPLLVVGVVCCSWVWK